MIAPGTAAFEEEAGQVPTGYPSHRDLWVREVLLFVAGRLHGPLKVSSACPGHAERLAAHQLRQERRARRRRVRRTCWRGGGTIENVTELVE